MTDEDINELRRRNVIIAIAMIILLFTFVLAIGLAGFERYFGLGIVDSLHNSTMYITGMGPITVARNNSQKLFASFYAVIAGFVFLAIGAFLLTEIIDVLVFPERQQ